VVQELLICPFDNNFTDMSGRHTLYNGHPEYPLFPGRVTFAEGRLGLAAAYFDGTSFLTNSQNTLALSPTLIPCTSSYTLAQVPNGSDFLLGATPNIMDYVGYNYVSVQADNNFTIDCWIKPIVGGERYYPICSSAGLSFYGIGIGNGWVLQIDTSTGHLQMIGYAGCDWMSSVLESTFQIPFNEWTHIAVSCWRTIDYPTPTCQMMWKNGNPDTYYAWTNNLCRFSNGMFPTNVTPNNYQYAPLFIGLGPKSGLTSGVDGRSWYGTINPIHGFAFKGSIDNLRICIEPRWEADNQTLMNPFTPPGVEITTTTTTTSTTTASTTYHHSQFVKDLLVIPFDSRDTIDTTSRHGLESNEIFFSSVENNSSHFSFNSYPFVEVLDNKLDWLLGSTLAPCYHDFHGLPSRATLTDNSFCIDCWVKPISGGDRYYPICSAADGGWQHSGFCLQIDTNNGHLQLCQYALESHYNPLDGINNLIESSFSIPMDTWSHIAVQSWEINPPVSGVYSRRNMYLNGVPDTPNGVIQDSVFAGIHPTSVIGVTVGVESAWNLFVGRGTVLDFPKTNNNQTVFFFNGYIKNFRVSEGPRFPTESPNFNSLISTTTTNTTISTTTGWTTYSTTTTTATTGTTTSTTRHPQFVKDLLVIPLDSNNTIDTTYRHRLESNNGILFSSVENNSSKFFSNNMTFIDVFDNRQDWLLGSTPVPPYYDMHTLLVRSTLTDNNFCIDCWIKPISGGHRYYPICNAVIGERGGGNLANILSGVSLQIDTNNGHLQLCQYVLGCHYSPIDGINNLIESSFSIPMNTWSHIAVQSWKINPTVSGVYSRRNMYLNGVPDTPNGIILNSIFAGMQSYHGWAADDDGLTVNLSVGRGIVLDFPKDIEQTLFAFNGYIKNFRISEGPRFPIDGSNFYSLISTTMTTTTNTSSTSITTGWTTYSTTTYSSTNSTSTTFYPLGFIRDLIVVPFDDSSIDTTDRHNTAEVPTSFSTNKVRGTHSAYFNGSSKVEYVSNESDWTLGGTSYGLYGAQNLNSSWYAFATLPDNSCSIDCYIKLESGGYRYYPICSSVNAVGTGWVLQVDTTSMKLQMVGFIRGEHILDFTSMSFAKDQNGIAINSVINLLMESSFTLEYEVWTHIALVSYKVANQTSAKIMYKNGVPDRRPNWVPSKVVWSNRGQVATNNPTVGYGSLIIGYCPGYDLVGSRSTGGYFKGNIDYFRIGEGYRFPVNGDSFTPALDDVTTTSTVTTTTTTGTTTATTTLSTMTTSTTSGTTSLTTNTTTQSTTTTVTTTQSTTTTTLSTTTLTTTTYTTTGTTETYTTTNTWTTTTISHTTTTPIPPYTNVSVDGVASANGYLSSYVPSNAFDHDISTFWLCSPYDDPPYWITYHWTDASHVVDQYKLYLSSGGRPKNWQLQGSNDNSTWDILDEVDNYELEGLIERVIENSTAYSYYRLYITAVWSRYYGIRVNEFQLYSNYHVNKPETQMHWIGYDFEVDTLVQRYCMQLPEGSGFREWKLQGSNDGFFWVDVDHQSQITNEGWTCIDIEGNSLSFSRWRLLIMNWPDYMNPKLVELELFKRP
jgi:hypothetical protein